MNVLSLGHSPIEKVQFKEYELYIKRDDLLGYHGFNGNKARKLHFYLCNDFPGITRLISYGSAQSNMLFSLSVLAKLKGWQLDFYVDHIAENLKENPCGNYAEALKTGAKVHVIGSLVKKYGAFNTENYVQKRVLPEVENALYIPEGGRNEKSEFGLKLLANELISWVAEEKIPNPKLMLPSGTGTTALYLQKYLPFEVLTCACVGGAEYLKQQFSELSDNETNSLQPYPTILISADSSIGRNPKKHHFGKLYPEFFELWQELLEQTNITFELLYDPLGWLRMMEYLKGQGGKEINMIYLHQGGLLGNESMLQRYQKMKKNR